MTVWFYDGVVGDAWAFPPITREYVSITIDGETYTNMLPDPECEEKCWVNIVPMGEYVAGHQVGFIDIWKAGTDVSGGPPSFGIKVWGWQSDGTYWEGSAHYEPEYTTTDGCTGAVEHLYLYPSTENASGGAQ
jgi:hypothetical protein